MIFTVKKVTPPDHVLSEKKPKECVEKLIQSEIEACSDYSTDLVANVEFHPLIKAVQLAFDQHRPLILSPDMIWLTIAQGLALHVNNNAEELRHKFVKHEGKEILKVIRNDFIKGCLENPWDEVFDEFSAYIKNYIGDKHGLLCSNFSTTGKVEKAASECVLMDVMQSYFKYEVYTLCGIPQVDLEGTTEDWEKIEDKVQHLKDCMPEWWSRPLLNICGELIKTSRGDINEPFWNSIYNEMGGSGKPTMSGWITYFFPYTKQYGSDSCTTPRACNRYGQMSHISVDEIPLGMSQVPFKWFYYEQKFDMEFLGGFVGVTQNKDNLAIRPHIGWAIRDKNAKQITKTSSRA